MFLKRASLGGLAVSLSLASFPSLADEALDSIFALGALKSVPVGEQLVYEYKRTSPDAERRAGVGDGEILVAIEAPGANDTAPKVLVTIDDEVRSRTLHPFPGDAGNPVVMIFLETVAGTMAKTAGGSPFYIRNRIKDAFRDGAPLETVSVEHEGQTVSAKRAVYQPFKGDKNGERLGIYEGMSLTFTLSDEIDGRFLALEAEAGDESTVMYAESIVLEKRESVE